MAVTQGLTAPESKNLEDLFVHNRQWAAQMVEERPAFFSDLLAQQRPQYMWIGCSDSRVPANQITGLAPGEVFVHRNVANVVVPTDLNCLSTIQYAVDMLQVRHLMVVGHYGCGGVQAALGDVRVGLADNWLRHVKDVRDRHRALLDSLPRAQWTDALCELNVIEQVRNVSETTVLNDAWARGQAVTLHGWVYGLKDGLLEDLHITLDGPEQAAALYRDALAEVATRACRRQVGAQAVSA
jgi:carbonic anhydrase